jgi:hypothetical protein
MSALFASVPVSMTETERPSQFVTYAFLPRGCERHPERSERLAELDGLRDRAAVGIDHGDGVAGRVAGCPAGRRAEVAGGVEPCAARRLPVREPRREERARRLVQRDLSALRDLAAVDAEGVDDLLAAARHPGARAVGRPCHAEERRLAGRRRRVVGDVARAPPGGEVEEIGGVVLRRAAAGREQAPAVA